MSDDTPQMWTAWENAMGEEAVRNTKKLLCKWHVLKNWHDNAKAKIQNKDLMVNITTWIEMLTR